MPNSVVPSAHLLANLLRRGRWLGSCFGGGIEALRCQSNAGGNAGHHHTKSQAIAPFLIAVSAANWGRPVSTFDNHVGLNRSLHSTRLYNANAYLMEEEYDSSMDELPEFDPLGDYLDEVTGRKRGHASDPRFTALKSGSGSHASLSGRNVDVQLASQNASEPSVADKRKWWQGYVGHGDGLEEPAWDNWMVLQEIGLTEPEADEVMRAHKALFAYDATEDIRSNSQTLTKHGLELAALLRKQPNWHRLLSTTEQLEGVIGPVAALIRGMNCSLSVNTVLSSRPELIGIPEAELKDRLAFLRSVGVTRFSSVSSWKLVAKNSREQLKFGLFNLKDSAPQLDNMENLIQRLPGLLPCQNSTVTCAMTGLTSLFGEERAKRFAESHPMLLRTRSLAIKNTYAKIRSRFGERLAEAMVARQPGILTLRWTGMLTKMEYLMETMGYSLHEVAECPTVLLRSLEGKIKKRHLALPTSWRGVCKPSLSSIMGCSDKIFKERVLGWAEKTLATKNLEILFGESGAAEIVRKTPKTVLLNRKRVLAKALYIMETMGRPACHIIKYPTVLRRSLEKCIVARHKRLGEQHHERSLSWIYMGGDDAFELRVLKRQQRAMLIAMAHLREGSEIKDLDQN